MLDRGEDLRYLPTNSYRTVMWVNSGGVFRATSVPIAATYQASLAASGVDVSQLPPDFFEGMKATLDGSIYPHHNDPNAEGVKISRIIPDGSASGRNVIYQAYVAGRRRW